MKYLSSTLDTKYGIFNIYYQLPDFCINIMCSRAEIFLLLGSNQILMENTKFHWRELVVIILDLTQNQFMISGGTGKREYDFEKQIYRLSKVFNFYYPQIVELYRRENVDKVADELERTLSYYLRIIGKPEYDHLVERSKTYWEEIDPSLAW